MGIKHRVADPAEKAITPRAGFTTVREAAGFLHVSRAKLYSMMEAQELAYAKFGSCRRISWDELLAFAERSTIR